HQPAQCQLAPAPTHLRAPQRGHEVARLALELALTACQRLDLRAQRGVSVPPLVLECLCVLLRALEHRAQRLHELRDGGLALLEGARGDRLVAPERLARELEEELAVGAQRLPRERVERGAQARLRLLEEGDALGLLARALLEAHARRLELDAQRLDTPHGEQLPEEESERRTEDQRGGRNRNERHRAATPAPAGARYS